jgi:hypothetical protein
MFNNNHQSTTDYGTKMINNNYLSPEEDAIFEWEKDNFRKHTEFKFNNGFAGTNKTGGIVKHTDTLTTKNITSFHSVPSKALCQEVAKRHKEDCVVINSDTLTEFKTVKKSLTHSILNLPDKAVIITHHSILNGNYYPKNDFTLFFDEVFEPCYHLELYQKHFDLPLKSIFNQLFDIENLTSRYALVRLNEDSSALYWNLVNKFRKKNDEDKPITDKIKLLLDCVYRYKCFDVWSHNQFNRDFLNGDGEKFVITIFLKPDIFYPFKEVRFSSAGFEYTLLYHIWKNIYGIKWTPDEEMMAYNKEPKLKDLNVYHYAERRNWSRSFADTPINDDKSIIQGYYSETQLLLTSKNIDKILFLKNKNDPFMFEGVECELAPFNSQGRNDFDHHHTLVCSGAFNYEKAFYELMDHFRIKESIYECQSRKSLSTDL